jgi:hypothetical protein
MKYLLGCSTFDDGTIYCGFVSDLTESELNNQLDDMFEKTEHGSNFVFQGKSCRKRNRLYQYFVMSLDKFWENSLKESSEL